MSPAKRLLVHILLILSGTASLVYEIIWTRVLQYTFGNTDLAVTTVLAVFMGGLALGGWLGGKYAARLRRPVLAYGVLEIVIALYAVTVTPLLYRLDFLYAIAGADPSAGLMMGLRFLVCALLLIVPTVCMGATLPILTVPLVKLDRAGEGVGLLYFVNTLGAVFGSAAAGFLLIRFFGLATSLYFAAGMGTLVLLGAVALDRVLGPRSPDVAPPGEAETAPVAAEASPPLGSLAVLSPGAGAATIMFMAGFCGFISLVNEVVWTRMLGFLLDGTVYGFAALLSSFLMGIALGSLFISPFIDGSRDL
jgi:spermidine synthase